MFKAMLKKLKWPVKNLFEMQNISLFGQKSLFFTELVDLGKFTIYSVQEMKITLWLQSKKLNKPSQKKNQ
jgi:hypothetical protein